MEGEWKRARQELEGESRNLTSPDSDAPAWSRPGGNAGGYLHLNGISADRWWACDVRYVLWCTTRASLAAFLKAVWASGVPTVCQCNAPTRLCKMIWAAWLLGVPDPLFCTDIHVPRLHLHRWSEGGNMLYMVQKAHLGRNRASHQRNPILLAAHLLTRSMCWL